MKGKELTIDNEQLTIMVSLRDEFENIFWFVSEGNALIVNCQLSIHPVPMIPDFPGFIKRKKAPGALAPGARRA